MLPNVVKETAVTMAVTFEKTRRPTNWPSIATKFARRGTHKSLLLSNWSSWRRAFSATQRTEFESNAQSSTSPGESCARLPADLRPHRHPWCHHQSTWSAQKGTEGIYRRRGKMAYRKRYVYAIIYKPQSSKNLALVGGRPYYHLDGANAKYLLNLKKS